MLSFDWWRTIFWLIPTITVYTIVFGTSSLVSSLFDREGRAAHWCARAWAWFILATTGVRVEVSGLERLTPGGTYVFVANHQSIYDIPVVFQSLPYQLRVIAKASLGNIPFFGGHLRRSGHILVDRANTDPERILARWASSVTRGLSLMVFPEGTRSFDGALGKFRGGSFLLAIRAGLPVVPISLSATRHVMRRGFITTRPGHVRLIVHEPISSVGFEPSVDGARSLADRARAAMEPGIDEAWLGRTGAPR